MKLPRNLWTRLTNTHGTYPGSECEERSVEQSNRLVGGWFCYTIHQFWPVYISYIFFLLLSLCLLLCTLVNEQLVVGSSIETSQGHLLLLTFQMQTKDCLGDHSFEQAKFPHWIKEWPLGEMVTNSGSESHKFLWSGFWHHYQLEIILGVSIVPRLFSHAHGLRVWWTSYSIWFP